MSRDKKNRILYLDTSLRNPERVKNFLTALYPYNNQVLTEDLAVDVEKKLIMEGLFRPNIVSSVSSLKDKIEFTESEAEEIMKLAPQDHSGEGTSGWPSRFRTHYFNMSQLGYIFAPEFGEEILFGESGIKLVNLNNEENGKISQLHCNAMCKFHANNPFINNANENIPLILIIKLIKLFILKTGKGLRPNEIPIIICWKNNDANELYEYIEKFRDDLKEIENENINLTKKNEKKNILTLKYCTKIFGDDWQIKEYNKGIKVKLSGTFTKDTTILKDYPDTYFRYIKESTLIYKKKINGKTYLVLDDKQNDLINYILENYGSLKEFNNKKDYFDFISSVDNKIFSENLVEILPEKEFLTKWIVEFGEETIEKELLKLAKNPTGSKSDNEFLKDIAPSLRLEWLLSLFVFNKVKNLKDFKPYYHINDDGQAIRHANGESNNHSGVDGIAFINNSFFTIEPTLLTKTKQYHKESFSNHKHLLKEMENFPEKKGYCLQISPEPSFETIQYAKSEKRESGVNLIPVSIKNFIDKINKTGDLKSLLEN